MATSVRLIKRYVWLIDTIRRAGRITIDEINQKWLDERSLRLENEEEIPERTFHRHRQAIADLFDIEILCDRSNGNTYYIGNEEILDRPTFTSWLFNGLVIDNNLRHDRDTAKRIMFEDTPGGNEYLSPIIEALAERRLIKFEYRSYNKKEISEFSVEPYGLKQSGRRWYLLCHSDRFEKLSVFALDRIEYLQIIDDTFEFNSEYDVYSYFNEVLGVNLDEDYDCENVKIRVYGHQRHYVESLPLHKSQKLLKREKEYSEYSFRLRPEYEFQHEILKMGLNAEVLSPQWLRDEIRKEAVEILKRYSNNY